MNRICFGLPFVGYIFAFDKSDDINYVGEPLFLTTYIESGRIDEAKEKASVKHSQMNNAESYAGYLTINKTYNSNTFFWYFPSQSNPQNDPLLIWMNGGPGSTSLVGLFAENGPFIITENGTVEMRKYSWHVNHNIIYIDNPVGTGYSFTENDLGYVISDEEIGNHVLGALIQFFELFPELKKNDFYVTGESYAGKYVPIVSHAIKTYNERAKSKINLKGLAIGNGFIDPVIQLSYYSDHLYAIGLLDSSERDQIGRIEEKLRALITEEKYEEAAIVGDILLKTPYSTAPALITNLTGLVYYYNYLKTENPVGFDRFIDWVTKSDVRKALHVGRSTFNARSKTVKDYLHNFFISATHFVVDLLEDYKVLIYHGQLDFLVTYIGIEKFVSSLNWTGAGDYKAAHKKVWRVEKVVAGYSKSAKNLNFVVVRNAGHYVPTDQPLRAWDMITRFTRNFEF